MKKKMKIYFSAFLVVATAVACVACGSPKKEAASKYLVLYYSQTGATKVVAEALQLQLGADIECIEAVNPYDGDFQQTVARGAQERENGIVPAIKPLQVDVNSYDVIFLGYPIWYGTYALPISGLLQAYDLSGKKIVPFCTFGSGGLESSVANLRETLPDADIADGYGVRNARLAGVTEEVDRFLKEQGFVEGDVETLADYSELQPVTEKDKELFDAACSEYEFPLGIPVSVGSRATSFGTDYKFVVTGQMGDEETTFLIYITLANDPDATPEFTRVVR